MEVQDRKAVPKVISRELKELGFSASKPRVARLIKSNWIQSKIRKQ
jgi:hypothetical protein